MGQTYGKEGSEVALAPDVTGPITSIVWKHNGNLALEWDGNYSDSYRHFKGIPYFYKGSLCNKVQKMLLNYQLIICK